MVGSRVAVVTMAVSLDGPPRVSAAGVATHGQRARHDHFQLPRLWSLHLYRYQAVLILDSVRTPIRPGTVSLVAPGVDIRYEYEGPSEHVFAHLDLPSDGPTRQVPAIQDAGAQTPLLSELMLRVVTSLHTDPVQASSQAWAVLHRLAALATGSATGPHAGVTAALSYVESHLAQPLSVSELARTVGLSHNHLTRLFKKTTGQTVVAYIRRRRLTQAAHLLRNSTLPISAVARSVGYDNLQAFNKASRAELGAPPRLARASARQSEPRV